MSSIGEVPHPMTSSSFTLLTKIQRLSSQLWRNYKYVFISSFFGVSFIPFFMNLIPMFIKNANNFISDDILLVKPEEIVYMIKTPGCTIPMMEPYHKDIAKYVYTPNVEICTTNFSLPLLGKNKTHLLIIPGRLQRLTLRKYNSLVCCYRPFYRPQSIVDIDSRSIDERVEYHPCILITRAFKVKHEFVYVTCQLNNVTIYEDYFLFPLLKKFNRKVPKRQKNDKKYNVIVLGLDTMSRLNFYRTMPRTIEYLHARGAIEMVGYNKVAFNTFPNLIAALMGMEENDFTTTCLPTSRATFDKCTFVWYWYEKKGYVTGFGEDCTGGTFNHLSGLASTPTDYYLHTFMKEAKRVSRYITYPGEKPICVGANYLYQILLDYVSDWIEKLQSYQIFGFFWEVSMSHDYLNYPMVMDQSYVTFFKRMDDIGRLNDTVFVLMSDHGMRWGDIVTTEQGRLEDRLPMACFLLPSEFRRQFPLATKNLLRNAQQLTTPYDLHQTLLDLVDPQESLTDLNISARQQTSTSGRGISLFLAVPENRTCETADIPEHWCTCNRRKQIDISDPAVKAAVASMINHLNFLLKPFIGCAPLQLSAVIEAKEVERPKWENKSAKTQREIQVVISVSPSNALLDASLINDGSIWNITGTVSRLNIYGNQSICVKDHYIKLFCYCK